MSHEYDCQCSSVNRRKMSRVWRMSFKADDKRVMFLFSVVTGSFSRACPFSRSSDWKIRMKICSLFRQRCSHMYVINRDSVLISLARRSIDGFQVMPDMASCSYEPKPHIYTYIVEMYILHSRCYAFLFFNISTSVLHHRHRRHCLL